MDTEKRDTKRRLLDTAIELIWKSSYGSVSVDEICKVSDVKKGSFYYHYPSKEDLAIAAMEDHYLTSRELFDQVFSASIPPLKRFENLANLAVKKQREALEKYGHVCGCPFASLGSEMAGQDYKIRAKTEEIFSRYDKYYESALRDLKEEGLIDQNVDTKVKANEVFTYVLGQVMMARIQNSLIPLERDLKSGLMRIIGVNVEGDSFRSTSLEV